MLGIGAAVCALACGADKNDTQSVDVPSGAATAPPRPNLPPPVPASAPPVVAMAPPPAAPASVAPGANDPAVSLLTEHCGQCHGAGLSRNDADGGINFIADFAALAKAGQVVPLDSVRSPLIQTMLNGDMPPPGSGVAPVTPADIQVVAAYIDNPRYWPAVQTAAECTPSAEGLSDFDQLYRAINLDLSAANAEDRPFYRYISLTDRVQNGACWEGQVERGRQSVVKMLNMLSIQTSLGDAVPIDRGIAVYRVDLRDFDWNRAIVVEGQNFADVWEAVAANNPYAVEFVGDDVDRAKADTATAFPLMFADQMQDVATLGNLYYAIVGIDVTQTLGDFILNGLGIDEVADVVGGDVIRAGTTRSRVSRQDRLVERHDLGVRNGVFWQSFDFEDAANQSIFQDPFGFQAGAREAIFTLPNGMLAFVIADANDAIVEDSDILLDSSQDNFRAVTAVSCSNCHALGLLPVVDEVAAVALANARAIGLNQDEILGLEFEYPAPDAFAKQVTEDSAFYLRSLEQIQVATQGTDPVAEAVVRFEQDVTLNDAAGDLGLAPDDLKQNLDLLDPVLSVLRGGTLDRDDFSAVFVASLCALSTSLENQPDPAVCAQALAALGD